MYGVSSFSYLTAEKQILLRQFSDVFYMIPVTKIREICDDCHWNENLCAERLRAYNSTTETQPPVTAVSFSEILQKNTGAITKSSSAPRLWTPKATANPDLPNVYDGIYSNIKNGYKVLVLMRGAPGSGKTHLSKVMVSDLMPGDNWKEFVLSADDYFVDSLGRYKYNVEQLDEAHKYCQARAREMTSLGWSPIVIDNTNMKMWEMMPYVQIAVQNGYIVEIMEPITPWRNSPGLLFKKTLHQVPRAKIQRMLESYEKCTASDLLSLLRGTAYVVPMPQFRIYPPPPMAEENHESTQSTNPESKQSTIPKNMDTETSQCITDDLMHFEKEPTPLFESTNIWQNYSDPSYQPKPARATPRKKQQNELKQQESNTNIPQANNSWSEPITSTSVCANAVNTSDTQQFPNVPAAWQPFEQEASSFWGVDMNSDGNGKKSEPMNTDQNENCGLLQLLKEGVKSINIPSKEKSEVCDESNFIRHRVGCENENQSFVALRQIYPNKPTNELWDLFVKCSGSVDWAVDILLRDVSLDFNIAEDNYVCGCDDTMSTANEPPLVTNIPQIEDPVKPQRSKFARNRVIPPELTEAKEAIEKSFVLPNDLYSRHVNKIRNKRNGRENSSNGKAQVDTQVQTDNDENDSVSVDSADGAEIIEMTLGEELVGQLLAQFQLETPTLTVPEKYKTNVFMPKSLARELLLLWMESVYNQIEEQRQTTMKEDEDFARLLKNPKYQNCKQSPENIKELLDMEFAWMIYKGQEEDIKAASVSNYQRPTDLASHLTQMKLCEIFPNVPKDTLLEVLAAHNNKFSDTVEVLKESLQEPSVDPKAAANLLIEKARDEGQKLDKEAEQNDNQSIASHTEQTSTPCSTRSRSHSPGKARRLALREFEDARNHAVHHSQLRAECYQKAKEAIQRGNSGVAAYYSSIANLHKKKIDAYNHRAANCIVEAHHLTQNNPDFIDLHYLHVVEAVSTLDIFIDEHITKLRSQPRTHKNVFIITGRGLHSSGGVATIKTRVKGRLKERNLKWTEINPGLLKVKVFAVTEHARGQ